jgi:hypothetical protein
MPSSVDFQNFSRFCNGLSQGFVSVAKLEQGITGNYQGIGRAGRRCSAAEIIRQADDGKEHIRLLRRPVTYPMTDQSMRLNRHSGRDELRDGPDPVLDTLKRRRTDDGARSLSFERVCATQVYCVHYGVNRCAGAVLFGIQLDRVRQ